MPSAFFRSLIEVPATYQARTTWCPWLAIGASLAIFIGAASLSLVLSELIAGASGGRSIFETIRAGGAQEDIKRYSMIWTAAMQVVLIVLTVGAASLFRANPKDVLALRVPSQGWGVLVPAFAVLFLVTSLYSGAAYLLWPHGVFSDLKPFHEMMRSDSGFVLALAGVVGAPLSEELLFRGFLLAALSRSRLGFWGAVIVSNTAWTALHAQYSLIGLGEVFLVGLVQSWLLWRTGSLWVPIICHAIYNGLILLALFMVPIT